MSLDAYMRFSGEGKVKVGSGWKKILDPIQGEALDESEAEKGSFEIYHFQWKVNRAERTGTEQEDGPKSFSDQIKMAQRKMLARSEVNLGNVTIEKTIDKASPFLFLACCYGCVFDSAKIVFRKDTGKGHLNFFVITLKEVQVEDFDIDITDADPPTFKETIILRFAQCQMKYSSQSVSGQRTSDSIAEWDRQEGTGSGKLAKP